MNAREKNDLSTTLATDGIKKKTDNSKIQCFRCKKLGHYSNQCDAVVTNKDTSSTLLMLGIKEGEFEETLIY